MTTKPPGTLADAIAQLRGKPAAPQPATLGEALAAVRGTKAATDAPTPPKAAHRLAEGDGDPLPGLRSWLKDRRHGR
ncbi:hypothetical protein [Xanthobacter sp. 126]|uniref:hypothetical protein n=1 Tax=Xanthobacter sp. 126 TaxID=1131814 RepID=UPI00045E6510|nr:hypothetical protein [Xanthobacter sp. 126]